jgi:hypothetical protein
LTGLLEVADFALQDGDLTDGIAGALQFGYDLLF